MAEQNPQNGALLLQVGLWTALWCFFHSWFVTHRWRDLLRRHFPRYHVFSRLIYVLASTLSLAVLMLWIHALPARTLFTWSGGWMWVRRLGLAEAFFLFWLGLRSYDNRSFLGVTQVLDFLRGHSAGGPAFRTSGILAVIRHPWYTGTIILLVFLGDYTDINLVWRGVFLVYTLIGTQLEENKLLRDIGDPYAAYRARTPRFFPDPRALLRPASDQNSGRDRP